jgi:hypothetical protein
MPRSKRTNIQVKFGNIVFYNSFAATTFIEAIEYICGIVGEEKFISENKSSSFNYIGLSKSDFSKYSHSSVKLSKSEKYYISSHSSTNDKKRIISGLIDKYNIDGSIELVSKELIIEVEKKVEHDNQKISQECVKRVINPFGGKEKTAAICITGDSGAGKSYRVEKTLKSNNHNFIFEILDPTSTGLLTQYQSGSYIRNNIGDFIIDAQNNPENFYTVVLDECHKDGFIDRINAELLQCLSSKRNDGLRYFQTNKVTDNLFSDLEKQNGRRIVPHNLGFILITSKPDIIHYNDDIKNRVDVAHIQLEDRNKDFTIENLLKKEEEVKEIKYENQD